MRQVAVVILAAALLAGCSKDEGVKELSEEYAPPREQWAPYMEACLSKEGWAVEIHADGSLETIDIPTEQQDQFDADLETCTVEGGFDKPTRPIDADRAEQIWDEYLAAAECVTELGYPPDQPPSKEFAIEALQVVPIDLNGWHPHMNVPTEEQERSYEVCPVPLI